MPLLSRSLLSMADSSRPPSTVFQPHAVTSLLERYSDGLAASGDFLSWGVSAVWGGLDLGSYGNFAQQSFVFVIDTGLNLSAVSYDLNVATHWAKSFVGGDPFSDSNGHGTAVASIIGSLANGYGIVGAAPGAQIVPLKVFPDDSVAAPLSAIVEALYYVLQVVQDNNLPLDKVAVNMSLGGSFNYALDSAIRAVADAGIPIALAAGNSGMDVDSTTAAAGDHPNVYTVSAVDSAYRMTSWSNYDLVGSADDLDLAAPGVAIAGYASDGSIQLWSGTSTAAPLVASLLATVGVDAGPMTIPYYNPTPVSPFRGFFGGNSLSTFTASTADPFALASTYPLTSNEALQEPAYFLVISSSLLVNEGGSITFNVESNQFGLTLDWQVNGLVSAADFLSSGLSGSLSLDSNGFGTVSFTLASDLLTEGPEALRFALISEFVEVASAEVTVVDTSVAPTSSPPVRSFFGGFFSRLNDSLLQATSVPESVEINSLGIDSQSIHQEVLLGLFGSDLPLVTLDTGFNQHCKDLAPVCNKISPPGDASLSKYHAKGLSFGVEDFIAERIPQPAPEIDHLLLIHQVAGLSSVQPEGQDFLNLYGSVDQYALT